MRTVALVLCLLALAACSACTSVPGAGDPDALAKKTLAYACPALQVAYQGVTAYELAGGKISARDRSAIDEAYQAASDTCAHPEQATAASAVVLVLRETQIIASVMKKQREV